MTQASPVAHTNASSSTAMRFGKNRNSFRLADAISEVARRLWPTKTAMELAVRSGISVRACEYWLERRTSISGEALAEMLRSEAGLDVLEAIMGDAKPAWWKRMKASAQRAALRRAQKDLQRQIEQMEFELDQ